MTTTSPNGTVDHPSIAGAALTAFLLFVGLVALAHPVAAAALASWTLVLLVGLRLGRGLRSDARARRSIGVGTHRTRG
ncbi:MAG: hypothetical protein ACLFMX_07455 [Halobacteriales archaeon]